MHNTLYIAEPIFSEKLQELDNQASFPPIKKIGITSGLPSRREKELLGTMSPVKISITKAWTGMADARKVESMLHAILGNSRLDGEYFWDGNETLVDAVSAFIATYHPEAHEIGVSNEADVNAAAEAAQKNNSQRIYVEVTPELEKLSIEHSITKSGRAVRFRIGEYTLSIGGRTADRYTLTIYSKSKTTEEALSDFEHSQELSSASTDDTNRRARIPMSNLQVILESIKKHIEANGF